MLIIEHPFRPRKEKEKEMMNTLELEKKTQKKTEYNIIRDIKNRFRLKNR